MTVLGIAFAKAPASQSPNIRRRSHGDAAGLYYAAMCVAFATVARWNSDTARVLVTDSPVPQEFAVRFETLGVEVMQVEFAHRPPAGFHGHFNASLYTLDAMAELASRFPKDDLCLMDPDVVAVRPLDPLWSHADFAVGALPIDVPPGEVMNGLSALQAEELHRQLDPSLAGPPEHFGGEVYVFRAETIAPVLERAEDAFQLALQRHGQGQPKFTTEEHLLNYALRRSNVSRLDDRVRRIWTAPRLREIGPDPERLVLWHLPAEKDRGFPPLTAAVEDRSSWFWEADPEQFRSRLGSSFGIPRRRLVRWAYDEAGAVARRTQHALATARSK